MGIPNGVTSHAQFNKILKKKGGNSEWILEFQNSMMQEL